MVLRDHGMIQSRVRFPVSPQIIKCCAVRCYIGRVVGSNPIESTKSHAQKILFIPGWMHSVEFYKKYEGLNIWLDKNEWDREINSEPEYVAGHCIGANFALMKFGGNKKIKFILVNPIVPKRSFIAWAIKWLKYFLFSGEIMLNDRKMLKMNYIRGFLKAKQIARNDLFKLLKKVSRENVVVLRGEDDKYFFDKEAADLVRLRGIKVIEVEGAGHSWDEKFDEAIKQIIK